LSTYEPINARFILVTTAALPINPVLKVFTLKHMCFSQW